MIDHDSLLGVGIVGGGGGNALIGSMMAVSYSEFIRALRKEPERRNIQVRNKIRGARGG